MSTKGGWLAGRWPAGGLTPVETIGRVAAELRMDYDMRVRETSRDASC